MGEREKEREAYNLTGSESGLNTLKDKCKSK